MRETLNSAIDVSRDERIKSSPSSKGNQIKWRTRDGYWLKADDMGFEGLSEAVAARLLEQTNIDDYAWYETCIITEEGVSYRGCISRDFLAPGEKLITLARLYETHGLDIYAEFDRKSATMRLNDLIKSVTEWTMLEDFGPWLGKLLEFDAFILNEDRHLQNIAVILKQDAGFRLMPVFDNGAAFMSDTRRDYPLTVATSRLISKVRSKPIVTHFDKQIDAVRDVIGLSLKFEGDITADLKDIEHYDNVEINRVARIIIISSRRYPYLF